MRHFISLALVLGSTLSLASAEEAEDTVDEEELKRIEEYEKNLKLMEQHIYCVLDEMGIDADRPSAQEPRACNPKPPNKEQARTTTRPHSNALTPDDPRQLNKKTSIPRPNKNAGTQPSQNPDKTAGQHVENPKFEPGSIKEKIKFWQRWSPKQHTTDLPK